MSNDTYLVKVAQIGVTNGVRPSSRLWCHDPSGNTSGLGWTKPVPTRLLEEGAVPQRLVLWKLWGEEEKVS